MQSPRSLRRASTQPPAAAQQPTAPEQPEEPAAAALGDGLPRLPRIRTRVGQPLRYGADASCEGGSAGGSGSRSSSGPAGQLCMQ